jgi:hypothetical protein
MKYISKAHSRQTATAAYQGMDHYAPRRAEIENLIDWKCSFAYDAPA